VPHLKPAQILIHGGGYEGGNKEFYPLCIANAKYFTERGFVSFAIDYRLHKDNGNYPDWESYGLGEWIPRINTAYPAIRDAKAAIRWVKAHASEFGISVDNIVINGGSAGATSCIAIGVVNEDDYKNEFTVQEDSTLSSTNLEQTSNVRSIISHWGAEYGVNFTETHDSKNRWSKNITPIVMYQGDADTTIPIHHGEFV